MGAGRVRSPAHGTIVGAAFAIVLAAYAASGTQSSRPPGDGTIAAIEQQFLDLRDLQDTIDVTLARGAKVTPDGVPLAALGTRYRALRPSLRTRLQALADPPSAEERRALETMRRTVEETRADPLSSADGSDSGEVDCTYDPERLAAGPEGTAVLRARVYSCFGQAARSIPVGGVLRRTPPGPPRSASPE